MSDLQLTLDFGGGAELLVGKLKHHQVPLFQEAADLRAFVYDNEVTDVERVFLFINFMFTLNFLLPCQGLR